MDSGKYVWWVREQVVMFHPFLAGMMMVYPPFMPPPTHLMMVYPPSMALSWFPAQ